MVQEDLLSGGIVVLEHSGEDVDVLPVGINQAGVALAAVEAQAHIQALHQRVVGAEQLIAAEVHDLGVKGVVLDGQSPGVPALLLELFQQVLQLFLLFF